MRLCMREFHSIPRLFRENFKQAAVMLLKRGALTENFILFYLYSSFENFGSKEENSCTNCCMETFDGAIFIESRSRLHLSIAVQYSALK